MKEVTLSIAQPPKKAQELKLHRSEEVVEAHAQDAAAMSAGGASGVVYPQNEQQLQYWLANNPQQRLLAQGALTSLTGGATPDADVVVSFKKMTSYKLLENNKLQVQAGVLLKEIDDFLSEHQLFYPPAPTYDGASIGGNIATNAAGAQTYRYGTTRDWIDQIHFVLRSGELLVIQRGEHTVEPGDRILLKDQQQSKTLYDFLLPNYRQPNLKKLSSGYYVKEGMDLLDFFIGTEGTLGFITQAVLATGQRKQKAVGLVALDHLDDCIGFALELRENTALNLASIEFFDAGCLNLVRRVGLESTQPLPPYLENRYSLLFSMELESNSTVDYQEELVTALESGESQVRAFNCLAERIEKYQLLEQMELALPTDIGRQRQLLWIRELIPMAVSEFLNRQKKIDPAVHKVAGDMIVAMEHFEEMMQYYYDRAAQSELELVVYGHISDGNVHPNFLCENAKQMQEAKDVLMDYADRCAQLKGAPMSEHGVGRHPLKKKMLENFLGKDSIEQMKMVKRALDPNMTLAKGVMFDE